MVLFCNTQKLVLENETLPENMRHRQDLHAMASAPSHQTSNNHATFDTCTSTKKRNATTPSALNAINANGYSAPSQNANPNKQQRQEHPGEQSQRVYGPFPKHQVLIEKTKTPCFRPIHYHYHDLMPSLPFSVNDTNKSRGNKRSPW